MFTAPKEHPLPWKAKVSMVVKANQAVWIIEDAKGNIVVPLPPTKHGGALAKFIVGLANREPHLAREVAQRIVSQ